MVAGFFLEGAVMFFLLKASQSLSMSAKIVEDVHLRIAEADAKAVELQKEYKFVWLEEVKDGKSEFRKLY